MKQLKLVLAILMFTFGASAQTLDGAARRQVVDIVAHLLETMYVIPETGRSLAAKIRGGSYESATTPQALADAIQRDLAAANDRHLRLRFNAERADMPPLTVEAWSARQTEGGPRRRMVDPAELRRTNYGIRRVERLEGNIGLLDISGFTMGDEMRAAVDAAMTLLHGSDAVIIDMRRCPGGAVEGVNYVASYFFGPERRVLMNRYDRPSDTTTESTTVDVAGKRLPDVELYVLTSSRSGSACESFPFTLQQHGRAKIVGERTAGAGYNNAIIPIGRGFELSVSVGTAIHPKSGKGWEAAGVEPDIAAPADRALDAARADALRKKKNAVTPMTAEDEVRKVEREWLGAYENRDTTAMQRIVADDFTIFFPNGGTQTKADILASLERGRASSRPSSKFVTEDVRARAYGDTVVLTGRVITISKRPDGTEAREASLYTDTYVRRDGRWQVVASHLGNVPAGVTGS
ncbi:MAG TPA: S41 family peptidase [Thermoanaerobaculia bacterium]|nr:S41 family peptidase [Thermoanaerobaculia bacterium]